MTPILIKTRIESDTLVLPEFRPVVGLCVGAGGLSLSTCEKRRR
jgi:hypothetical protein